MVEGPIRRLRPNRLGAAAVAVFVVVPGALSGLVLVAMGIWERSLEGPVRLLPIGMGLGVLVPLLVGLVPLLWLSVRNPVVLEVSSERIIRRDRYGTEVAERPTVRAVEVHWSTGRSGGVDSLKIVGNDGSEREWLLDWWLLVSVRKVLRTFREAGWPLVDVVRTPFSTKGRVRSVTGAPSRDA